MIDVLVSAKEVVNNSQMVKINENRVREISGEVKEKNLGISQINLFHYPWDKKQMIEIVFLFNTINFCFWAEKEKPKWTINLKGKDLDGSIALFRCLEEAVKQSQDLLNGDYLANITLDHLKKITKGNIQIPLLMERLNCLNEAGKVIEQKFGNSFYNICQESNNHAWELTKLVVENFPKFNDISKYQDREIAFYKRAQLNAKMVSDILVGLGEKPLISLDKLTAFADYKIPQILRSLGVLEYSANLANRIDQYEIIEAGSVEEIEIRANSIWAVELIKQELEQKYPFVTSSHIDSMLWLKTQNNKGVKPYHRTYTIAY